jgi:DNA invertase Pin-like site-specific DNA recombinase
MDARMATPKAYSYIRFSTPEQGKGNSLQRQTEAARAWADRERVPLDTELTFEDHGVSGFTGANRETGALGVFLERVKDGTVPAGSWLIVESLDRISRQVARKAVRTIEDIVEAGIGDCESPTLFWGTKLRWNQDLSGNYRATSHSMYWPGP